MASYGYTFQSGDGVTPTRLNAARTVSDIVNADINSDAAIALSKLATGALPTAITTTTANMVDASVTAAKLSGAQTGSAPIYGCRAWVNFNGSRNEADSAASTNGANVKITASGNVSSVLKNGTGDYTITFSTAMPDALYCAFTTTEGSAFGSIENSSPIKTTTQLRVGTRSSGGTLVDREQVFVCIFR